MESELREIIDGLLCTNNDRIRCATEKLRKAQEHTETLPALCSLIVSELETQVRHFAAVLLYKQLQEHHNWELLPAAEHMESIRERLLQALMDEKQKSVGLAIARAIGVMLQHEQDRQSPWLVNLVECVCLRCSSEVQQESEQSSAIFATLADAAPDQLIDHMQRICELFANALIKGESNGNLATATLLNLAKVMSCLIPFLILDKKAAHTLLQLLPLFMQMLHAFAQKGDEYEFAIVFEVLDIMAEYVPQLLDEHMKLLMEFCLATASSKDSAGGIVLQLVSFMARIVRSMGKALMREQLLARTVGVIFELMCQERELDDDDDLFSASPAGNNSVIVATETLDLLALHMPPAKLLPPLLQLLEPALLSAQAQRRRAAFIAMAAIAEGCSRAIRNTHLAQMMRIITSGMADDACSVRIACFYALGQFAQHLQPEIAEFAATIFPALFITLQQLLDELSSGKPEPPHTPRMFYALESYCQSLQQQQQQQQQQIVPFLPTLMELLLPALEPANSPSVRRMALSAIAATAQSAKQQFVPYFAQMVTELRSLLVEQCPEYMWQLRNEAMDAMATLMRVFGTPNCAPIIDETTAYCLEMLATGPVDADFRRPLYNLLGSLSLVASNEQMAHVLPQIMHCIIAAVVGTEDMLPADCNDCSWDDEPYAVENDYMYEKEAALQVLKEFAQHTGSAFTPHLQSCFEQVYKVLGHPQNCIRQAAVEALCAFVLALHRQRDAEGVKCACEILMPALVKLLLEAEGAGLLPVLYGMGELLAEVKQAAVPAPMIAHQIFQCIENIFQQHMDDDDDDEEQQLDVSEHDELLMETAGNVLPQLGKALTPETFAPYFERIYCFYLRQLRQADQRTFVYGALAASFQSLDCYTVRYFDTLCPVFMGGLADREPAARQNVYFGLGELVYHAKEASFEDFPDILQALLDAIPCETNAPALDNLCGALARLIVTNHQLVSLPHVLPALLQHWPLREDVSESAMLMSAFQLLYTQCPAAIDEYLEQLLVSSLAMLHKQQSPNAESTASAIAFVQQIGKQHADKLHKVLQANSDFQPLMRSLGRH
ncbi:CG32165 [Drosophila busckii]|uniref:CG32165 n=1 Tax=Drosophila busckii TaxID=30019 RepID=A0A0M4FA63_DROBS|nr:importin-4 [Drosophila busckii]ALC49575.1 CG32165 [Drosophila busckii]